MNKLRKVLLGLLVACTAVSASLGLAACADDFPDFKNPTTAIQPPTTVDPPPVDPNANKYTVYVRSTGGLPLDNVQIAFKKDGETQLTTISRNGEITVNLTVGEYELEVDATTLPAGYYLPEGEKFTVSGANGTVTVSLPSKIISSTAPSSKRYVPGDIMHDFSYVNSDGVTKQLSELLETKKAVLINFFFISCGPCRAEFPVIDKVYSQYKNDIEFVALSNQDSAAAIRNFQSQEGYSFDMAYDESALYSNFSVDGYPTSIMVDRYGAVAYRSRGTETRESSWQALFARFAANDYKQVIDTDNNDDGETGNFEYVKPSDDIETPDYDSFVNFINGDGANGKVTSYYPEDNEGNWPWQLRNDESSTYLAASNTAAEPSYAILYADVNMTTGDILSFEYNVKCVSNYDTLAVIMEMDSRDILVEYSGDSKGWQTEYGVYVANRDVSFRLAFLYQKLTDSNKTTLTDEFIGIRNITVQNVEDVTDPMDFARSASVEGITVDDIKLGEDGYYHVSMGDKQYDGALLLVDLWNKTAWSTNRTGSSTFTPEGSQLSYDASMYYFSFWELSDYKTKPESSNVSYLYTDQAFYLNQCLDMQNFSKNRYLPVTPALRAILEEFCEAFKDNRYHKNGYEEGEWIEMCYFYQHYNGDHAEGEECYKFADPVKGMSLPNAIEAHLGTDNHVNIDTISSFNGGGRYYKFTAETTGVYKVRTIIDSAGDSPTICLYTSRDGVNPENGRMYEIDLSYDNILSDNCVAYVYLEAGQTIYLQMMQFMGTTAEYNFAIEYVGETYDWLRTASTAGGMFIGTMGDSTYGAVNSALNDDDGCYYTYTINSDGEFVWGSKLYIDFTHDNFCDERTLLKMIEDGVFNLSSFYLDDYTAKMREYYNDSIRDKSESDELYGVIEASSELVEIIAVVLEVKGQDGDALETGYWKSLACYYEHIGPENRLI